MVTILKTNSDNAVICNAAEGIVMEEVTDKNGNKKIGLKGDVDGDGSRDANHFFFFYNDLNLENATIHENIEHALPGDFEGFKYCYTPESGFTLNPEFIVSYEEGNPIVDENGEYTNEPVKKVIKYQSGKIITIHPSGEVEET
tara:strand:- start:184 stop:612 length:429 start_codon:yes stop_codon:yes gene_type:complete